MFQATIDYAGNSPNSSILRFERDQRNLPSWRDYRHGRDAICARPPGLNGWRAALEFQ